MREYDIEELIVILKKHAEEYEKLKREYREKNGEPSYDDSFNLPLALLSMCKSIENLYDRSYEK